MSRYILYIGSLWLLLMACMGCSDDDKPASVHALEHHVLVYLVADNTLNSQAEDNLQAITRGYLASSKQAELYVYKDNKAGAPSLYHFTAEGLPELVCQFDETDSTDPAQIQRVCKTAFARDGRQNPVNTLILWSHGTNWVPGSYRNLTLKSFGDDDGKYIDIAPLAASLEQMEVQTVMFDACLMGSAEVAAEFAGVARYLVASPTEILAAGFPYEQVIPILCRSQPDLKQVIDAYHAFYDAQSGRYRSGILALYDLQEMQALAASYGALFRAAYGNELPDSQPLLHYDRFTTPLFFDLDEAAQLCKAQVAEKDPATAEILYNAFHEVEGKVLLYCKHTDAFIYQSLSGASGMSVYWPMSSTQSLFEEFYRSFNWYQWMQTK